MKLQREKEAVVEEMEALALARQQLEEEAVQAANSLRREHDARLELEGRLDEVQLMNSSTMSSVKNPSLFDEIDGEGMMVDDFVLNSDGRRAPMQRNESLMAELQQSVGDETTIRVQELEESLAEVEQVAKNAQEEMRQLEEKHMSLSRIHREQGEREEHRFLEKEAECKHLKQRLVEMEDISKKIQLSLQHRSQQLEEKLEQLQKENISLLSRIADLEETAAKERVASARQEQLEKENSHLKEKEAASKVTEGELQRRLQEASVKANKHDESMKAIERELRTTSLDLEKIHRVAGSLTNSQKKESTVQQKSAPQVDSNASASVLLAAINDQVKTAKVAMEMVLQKSLQQVVATASAADTSERNLSDESKRQYQVRIQRLQQQLSTKKQEVLTLRTVLQAQRSTSSSALERQKAVSERQQRSAAQHVEQLMQEVKRLKSEIAENAAFRSMFVSR